MMQLNLSNHKPESPMLNNNSTSALNVVVTAATSAVGRETVRQLVARGHSVTGLTQGSDGAVKVRADGGLPAYSDLLRAGEIKSILTMAKADVVIHTAPQLVNNFPYKDMPFEEGQRILTEGTTALLKAVEGTTVKFIVFTSLTGVYGDTHGEWVDETHETRASGVFKAAVEAEKKVLSGSVPAVVLRAGLVYGADDEGTQELGDACRSGRGVLLGDDHNYLNWVYAGDLAKAAVLAAEQQPAGEIFNIVDDVPAPASAFAGYLASGLGIDAPRNVGTLPDFARRLMVSPTQEALLKPSLRVKNDKAKQSLGWAPRYADYRTGIDQTLMLWRAIPVG
jgi:nucleoside-diphosphate-sugar epimerase